MQIENNLCFFSSIYGTGDGDVASSKTWDMRHGLTFRCCASLIYYTMVMLMKHILNFLMLGFLSQIETVAKVCRKLAGLAILSQLSHSVSPILFFSRIIFILTLLIQRSYYFICSTINSSVVDWAEFCLYQKYHLIFVSSSRRNFPDNSSFLKSLTRK